MDPNPLTPTCSRCSSVMPYRPDRLERSVPVCDSCLGFGEPNAPEWDANTHKWYGTVHWLKCMPELDFRRLRYMSRLAWYEAPAELRTAATAQMGGIDQAPGVKAYCLNCQRVDFLHPQIYKIGLQGQYCSETCAQRDQSSLAEAEWRRPRWYGFTEQYSANYNLSLLYRVTNKDAWIALPEWAKDEVEYFPLLYSDFRVGMFVGQHPTEIAWPGDEKKAVWPDDDRTTDPAGRPADPDDKPTETEGDRMERFFREQQPACACIIDRDICPLHKESA